MLARKDDVRIRRTVVKDSEPTREEYTPRNDEVDEMARTVAARRYERNKKPKSRKKLIIFIILVLLVAVIWLRWDIFNPVSVWNWITVSVTGGETGDGYPTKAEGSNVVKMDSISNQLALLKGNELTVYNRSAGVVYTRNHTFANPILETAGNHILLAEMGGTRIQTQILGGSIKEINAKANIVAADIAENGSFIVATGSNNSYVSEIVCYTKNGAEKIHWYSSDLLVLDVAIRDDGKKASVIGVLSNNGAVESRLLVFDTSSDKEPIKYSGTNVMLVHTEFLSNSVIGAVGDTESWTVSLGKDEINRLKYDDKKLLGYAFSNSQIGVVMQSYGSTKGFEFVGMNKNGKEAFRSSFDTEYQDISTNQSSHFYVLTNNSILSCSSAGKVREKELRAGGLNICGTFGGDAIVLGLTTMDKYSF